MQVVREMGIPPVRDDGDKPLGYDTGAELAMGLNP